MFAIILTEKGGDQRRLEFDKSEVTIGRVQGNDIVLPKGNVSKRHARIVLKDGKFIIVDLKSTNGTYVNGRKITSPLVVKDADKIYIGDYILGVDGASAGRPATGGAPVDSGGYGAPPPAPEPMGAPSAMPPPAPRPAPAPAAGRPTIASGPSAMPMGGPGEIAPPPAPPMPGPPPPAPPTSLPMPQVAPPRPNRPLGAPAPAPAPASSPPVRPTVPSAAPVMPLVSSLARGDSGPARAGGQIANQPKITGVRPVVPMVARGVQNEPMDAKVVRMLELQDSILDRLVPRLDLDNVPLDRLGDEALWQKAESAIVDLVETLDSSGELPGYIDQDTLIKEALNEALGLGPLEDLLADDSFEEIIVDRRDRILVGKNGKLASSGKAFSSDETFRRVIERLVAPTGHMISEASPLIDVRLRDGSRLTAAVPPVAVRGACLTLRKPRAGTYSLRQLLQSGCLSPQMADFLTTCVAARRNILVCGSPGSGKSMVLTALANAIPGGERVVSVEDVAELALDREDWIALEARPGDASGASDVNLGMMLQSALRMRADRLVVGDVRGAEALELVSALASACDGSLMSVAGDGAQAALSRLAAMTRLGAPGASVEAIRDLVACAVDVVVHVARYADGVVRVASVAVVQGAKAGGFDTQEVFCFRGSAGDGGFIASGMVPAFYSELEARGMPADTSIFRA